MNFEWIMGIDDIEMLRNSQPFHDKSVKMGEALYKYAEEQRREEENTALRAKYTGTRARLHPGRARALCERFGLTEEYVIQEMVRDGNNGLLTHLLVPRWEHLGVITEFRRVFVHFSLLDLPENNSAGE